MLIFPNAKINLGLNIIEKRPDGYHNLETVFFPIPLQDVLEVNLSTQSQPPYYTFQNTGNIIEGNVSDNLVVKAYNLLKTQYNLQPIDICLSKHIPMGAGLGGGSSDCAFMIKLLNNLFRLQLSTSEMETYAALLGADCAFFIQNKPVFACGIGNIFTPVELSLTGYYIVIVKPDIFISTKQAFSLITPHKPQHSLKEIIGYPIEQWKEYMVNDFEYSVFKQYPEMGTIKNELYNSGAIYAAMSGSGSALFGIFKQPVENIDKQFHNCFCWQKKLI